ncbi:putative amino acid permease YhdG [Apilactobacillus kunkeei]|uniref:APC family permease n=1 Tax=Apilactobacillus kunkeei TaxID=148814 RepID=UPI00200A1D59|nr:amino acid permease [Apilactobacillus kunkeei]MCK8633464.1 amino acid permease [Apilactobacillus kunkeei]CAI2633010.1 putative amino acid permease YhdG [Apilactobacillus kunkeei]CAI2633585.1 putative amino acid permease YhdG [Apilactobacillus kunkeei]CAI2633783.1 putative amino acid permease YhdG [Apilactobacillus kunkeei]CAI2634609.1 putative amino acid permease YhdG [Apilactobacillus kunkeei]
MQIFKKESVSNYLEADSRLSKSLTTKDLIGLGIGAVIGTGIFILPGHEAASHAGPAVAIAFLMAAIVSGLVGMAYAEFSSAMPIAGSAYSFGSVVYGEIVGWILGWALILEYFLAVSAEATGFAAYFNNNILDSIGIHLPTALQASPMEGGVINISAVLIVVIIAGILLMGSEMSKRVENFAVIVKVAIIIIFIIIGAFYIKTSNYVPFYPSQFHSTPFGMGGIFTAAATVFFAFIGFDALASNSAETIDPGKNVIKGIIGTVVFAVVLYVAFSMVLTGIVNYKELNVDDPAAYALQIIHLSAFNKLITIGALFGIFTAMVTMFIGGSRLVYALGRDGLLPKFIGRVHSKHSVPKNAIIIATIVQAIFAGLVPLTQLASLINAGTLIAFAFISFGIIKLRRRKDIKNTGFKMPWYPFLPIVAGVFSIFFIIMLPDVTKISVGIWIVIGFIFYFVYGVHHSKLQKQE